MHLEKEAAQSAIGSAPDSPLEPGNTYPSSFQRNVLTKTHCLRLESFLKSLRHAPALILLWQWHELNLVQVLGKYLRESVQIIVKGLGFGVQIWALPFICCITFTRI